MSETVRGPDNGRVRLSWAQIAWGIATLATLIGSWYDTRGQITLLRAEVGMRVVVDDKEHARMWEAIDEAGAAQVKRSP